MFDLNNDVAYQQWRSERLLYKQPGLDDVLVEIDDPFHLSDLEITAIANRCVYYNMAIYQLTGAFNQGEAGQDKTLVHAIGRQMLMGTLDANLRADEDSVSSLEVRAQQGNQYIPYTNKALSWHTDGYYNPLDKQIFGIIMHCVRPAEEGGVNRLLNHEQVYIALRDENSAYIDALKHPQAMTIPENVEAGQVIREAQAGPVFMLKPQLGSEAGRLHMRYSARTRNIVWRDTMMQCIK